jgi:hypothetical protein
MAPFLAVGNPGLLTGPPLCVMIGPSASCLREDDQPLSAMGILLQLAYRLHRHFAGGWSVARWLGTLLALAAVVMLFVRRSVTWDVILIAALFSIYVLFLLWAGRKGYVHFRTSAAAANDLKQAPANPPLQPEEKVPVWACGPFTVHGQDQYYVDLQAGYESVRSREHIVMARIDASRFLLLGSWPEHELGWWYIFIQPAMLRQIRIGYLHFGRQPRLALEIVYAPDQETRRTAYLASEATLLRRIWEDLRQDAPSEVNGLEAGAVG